MINWKKGFRSFAYAWKGAKVVWHEEQNFQILTLTGLATILISILFHFTFSESVAVIFAVTIVLITEAINTALEDTLNKIEPNQDADIGRIKDIGAFFLVLAMLSAFVLGLLVFGHHFLGLR